MNEAKNNFREGIDTLSKKFEDEIRHEERQRIRDRLVRDFPFRAHKNKGEMYRAMVSACSIVDAIEDENTEEETYYG